MAGSGGGGIEDNRDVGRLLFFDDGQHRVGEAKNGGSVDAL